MEKIAPLLPGLRLAYLTAALLPRWTYSMKILSPFLHHVVPEPSRKGTWNLSTNQPTLGHLRGEVAGK